MRAHRMRASSVKAGPLSFFSSSNSTTTSLTLPNDLGSQDLLILHNVAYSSSSTIPTLVSPSGWTSIANQTDSYAVNQTRATTWYIAGDPSLSGTSVSGMTGTLSQRMICVVFRNATYQSVGTNTYDSSSSTATGSLTAGTTPYIGLAFVAGSGSATLPTVPSGVSYTPSSSGNIFAAYTLNGGAGTYTTNDSGSVTSLKLLTLNLS